MVSPSLFQLGKLKDFNEELENEPEESISSINLQDEKNYENL